MLNINLCSGSFYLSLVYRERILSECERITICMHSCIIEVNAKI